MAPLVRQYLQGLGVNGKAAVIGSGMKAPARFAAFANGVSIHADDFDDTQLSAAKDRVYGLLTHPSVTTLTPAFAICELTQRSGKDFMLAYHVGVEVEIQNRGSDRSAPLQRRISLHGHLRIVWQRGGVRQVARPRCAADSLCSRRGGGRRRRLARQLRLHDQALPRRACGRKRHRRGGSCRAGLDGCARHSGRAARLLSGRGRRIRSRLDRESAGQALDLCFARSFHQAVSFGLLDASGHGRMAGHDSQVRYQAGGRGEDRHRHEPQSDHHALSSPADDRTAGQVQHGVWPQHSASRPQGGLERISGRRGAAARRAGDDQARELLRRSRRPRRPDSTR